MQTSGRLLAGTGDRRATRVRRRRLGGAVLTLALVVQTMVLAGPSATPALADTAPTGPAQLVPIPANLVNVPGESFVVGPATRIVVAPDATEALPVAETLAAIMRQSTGYPLPVATATPQPGDIGLHLTGTADLGAEGYRLDASTAGVRLEAAEPAGLFYAVQTLRQLLPPWIESPTVRPGPWTVDGVRITDSPRYAYRGVMLDIARHFQSPEVAKRLIDQASAYKLNVLHLHVSDDQGFRIAINGRPELTTIGAQFSINNDPGGYWTQAEYVDVVNYAAARFMTVIPEVDSPGHTNAIVMSYAGPQADPVLPDVNCTNRTPPQWNLTGAVGYSAMCPESPNTWAIITDIVSQLSAMTPGPYYHLGGDEVPATTLSSERYVDFVDRESQIVKAQDKVVMGWAEISQANFDRPGSPQAVAQFWNNGNPTGSGGDSARRAVQKGMKVVMSPANHTYLDMQQFVGSPLGLSWAGRLDVSQFYNWSGTSSDPGAYIPARTTGGVTLPAVTDADIIGVEAPIWSETLRTLADIEFQVFPRMPATAEIGWSPNVHPERNLASFVSRIAGHGARRQVQGQNFYASPQVPWRVDVAAPDITTDRRTVSGEIASIATPGAAVDQVAATIDWGDGTTSAATLSGTAGTNKSINGIYSATAQHAYARDGVYRATITATRPGGTTTAHFTVVVNTCTATVSGNHNGPLLVAAGVTCLAGATVSGPVTVRAGASLIATGTSIRGPVTATGAAAVELLGGSVSGPVTINGTTGDVIVERVGISGPLVLTGTATVPAPLVAGNTVNGPLACTGNTPAPVNGGLPNTVHGPSTGQCRAL
ncbi:beta-N-acetylhexosaminidase [Micromonospora sp. NBC_01796]|uniref:beta-N-acetylhexosaminidase n=1 Tax=Micromonospora sp. NBC_01796 TaxID=2975987 RepID=UPI002DD7C4A4|nr:beta-N-acetylhexosaminidase [Micromonospora sp. NBC_01796]WSA85810.1 beta-N-acetylhexosaminidase [Micromonospora sp. NBC_01796]